MSVEDEEKNKLRRRRILTLVITILVLGAGTLLYFLYRPHLQGFERLFTDQKALQQFVQGFGIWGPIIFFVVQMIQVIISPIPGGASTIAGGALFGVVPAFLLSGASVILGSLVGFYLARIFGQRLVIALIGQKTFDKYSYIITGKLSLTLLVMFLIPFFPDDMLCLIAGLSPMPGIVFLILLFVGRLPGIFVLSLVGGNVIQLDYIQWIVAIVISAIVIVVFLRYGSRFEGWLNQKMLPKSKREKVDKITTSPE